MKKATSSLNEISTGHLGNKVVKSGGGVTAVTPPHPPRFLQQDSGNLFSRRRERFSSVSDIRFMLSRGSFPV